MAHFKNMRKDTIHGVRNILILLSLSVTVATLFWHMLLVNSTNAVPPPVRDFDLQSTSSGKASNLSSQSKMVQITTGLEASSAVRDRNQRGKRSDKTRKQNRAENPTDGYFPYHNDDGSKNNKIKHESITPPSNVSLQSALPQRSPHANLCRVYEHLDLPASNESGPQYTYRYRHVRVIRAPDPLHLCDNDTQVFAAINSGALYFDRRNAMRDTWVSHFRTDPILNKTMRIVFLIGVPDSFTNRSESEAFQSQLNAEINRYGDVLLVDVIDTYMNITQKLLTLYNFVLNAPECSPARAPHLRYIFKPDDDVFVNPTGFMKRLGDLDFIREKHTASFFYGQAISTGPHREEGSCWSCKWYVPRYVWPSNVWGFSYANGCAFWQTVDALRAAQTAALCLHVLFIDDVYLTGYLRERLDISLFAWSNREMLPYRSTPEKMALSHVTCNLSPSDLRAVWELTSENLATTTTPYHVVVPTSPATATGVHFHALLSRTNLS